MFIRDSLKQQDWLTPKLPSYMFWSENNICSLRSFVLKILDCITLEMWAKFLNQRRIQQKWIIIASASQQPVRVLVCRSIISVWFCGDGASSVCFSSDFIERQNRLWTGRQTRETSSCFQLVRSEAAGCLEAVNIPKWGNVSDCCLMMENRLSFNGFEKQMLEIIWIN